MTDPAPRRTAARAVVVRTQRLSPSFLRVVLGGDGLADLVPLPFADSYVKLVFLDPRLPRPLPVRDDGRLDVGAMRAAVPKALAPRLRAYTVRDLDVRVPELTIDVVLHGESGLAGPWAAQARTGDEVWVQGPGGAYAPAPDVDVHLLVGDESALPAIAVALERLPRGARAQVLLEIPDERDELELTAPPGCSVDVTWVHRHGAQVGVRLVAEVTGLPWPMGRVGAFVHGEAGFVAVLRRYLRVDRQVPREDLSASGYWRLGVDDEGWRAEKKRWAAEVEAAEVDAGPG